MKNEKVTKVNPVFMSGLKYYLVEMFSMSCSKVEMV